MGQVRRAILVGVLAVFTYGLLAAFGGFQFAGVSSSGASGYQYQYDKVTICHKGQRTMTITVDELPRHLAHGDTIGKCKQRRL
jgi:hypothetical protein